MNRHWLLILREREGGRDTARERRRVTPTSSFIHLMIHLIMQHRHTLHRGHVAAHGPCVDTWLLLQMSHVTERRICGTTKFCVGEMRIVIMSGFFCGAFLQNQPAANRLAGPFFFHKQQRRDWRSPHLQPKWQPWLKFLNAVWPCAASTAESL